MKDNKDYAYFVTVYERGGSTMKNAKILELKGKIRFLC